jgi:biotin--protein ligase
VIHNLLGCGLNVLNIQPITSLAQLQGAAQTNILSIERTAASVISKFESMWAIFTYGGVSFDPFMDLYLKRWIHSFVFWISTCRSATTYASSLFFDRDQVVTLTTTTPHRQVRVVGITEDHGLLRTIPEWSGTGRFGSTVEYVDLQPDGNSFDLMANLIKSKT